MAAADAGVLADARAVNKPPAVNEPSAVNEPPAWGATPVAAAPSNSAESASGNSVVNPDGSITTRLPDGSTQTVVRLPGGATIVTSTTQPGAYSQAGSSRFVTITPPEGTESLRTPPKAVALRGGGR